MGDALNLTGIITNLGLGGLMLYIVFFRLLPSSEEERKQRDTAFLAALEKQSIQAAVERKEYQAIIVENSQRTQLLIKSTMMVLTGRCPDLNIHCPFKTPDFTQGSQ